jgi:hypothetical protein
MGSRTLIVLAGGLTVPWTRVPMYNTIMGLAAGVGLVLFIAMNYFTHGGLTYNTR